MLTVKREWSTALQEIADFWNEQRRTNYESQAYAWTLTAERFIGPGGVLFERPKVPFRIKIVIDSLGVPSLIESTETLDVKVPPDPIWREDKPAGIFDLGPQFPHDPNRYHIGPNDTLRDGDTRRVDSLDGKPTVIRTSIVSMFGLRQAWYQVIKETE